LYCLWTVFRLCVIFISVWWVACDNYRINENMMMIWVMIINQVVKVIWHKAALTYSPMAPMCPFMRAHRRHLANTIEFVLPSAHPSPQSIRQIDRFNPFSTAHGRKNYILQSALLSQNLPLPMGDLDSHQIYDCLGASEPTTQTASIHLVTHLVWSHQ